MNRSLVLLLALGLTGCAGQGAFERQNGLLSNSELLHHRHWVNRLNGNEALMQTMPTADTRYSRRDQIATVTAQGFIAGQADSMGRHSIDLRVERNDWVPVKDSPADTPQAHVAVGEPSMTYPGNPIGVPTGSVTQLPAPIERRPAATTAIAMNVETKYQIIAEKLAKSNDCVDPAASLNTKAPGTEIYGITCASGHVIVVRCDYNDCRLLTSIP